MATKITETEITSDQTRHRAWFIAYCGWVVSWLPGRFLTQSGAITAMNIAEAVAGTDFTPEFNRSPAGLAMWLRIDAWADELGLSGPHAVAEASLSPEEHGSEPEPCELCQLRAERGIEPPEGGCTCRAVFGDVSVFDDVSFEEGEIRVAQAMVAGCGAKAPGMCRKVAAECEAEGDYVCRDSFLRFAGYAEKALAE